ncbi:hypothetical protein [Brevundimonas sp. UBA2416]|uniref:hypothetical protein n=1 Tax=Brevundimonas sp. UBA2416 TaxID=1946124 RepID=UPI0025BD9E50|nr:hypothetical protein [Brevundimonas sp. UBA2416]
MEISFCDAQTCAVFNSLSALRAKYGVEVAGSIVVRMGVLGAAPVLAAVPRKPPVSLTTEEGTYTVSLAQSRRLRFRPDQHPAGIKLSKITAIEILGVEG